MFRLAQSARLAAPAARGVFVRTYTADGKLTVGFIGLGNMGGFMARNLAKNGIKLVVNDISVEAVKGLTAIGAEVGATPAEVAAKSDAVITMLPSNPHVKSVYEGKEGVLKTLRKGTLCIDASTIDPAVSQGVAAEVVKAGGSFVDAPVSGGVRGAEAGTLTFMVGGPEADFERAKTILKFMGSNIVHCGANGTGQVAKICNNMLLGISMIGVSETMNLGVKLGIDPKLLAKILNTSTGRCWSSDSYNPCPGVMENVPASRGYAGGFGSALMAKDLGLAMAAAAASGASVPLGSLANQIYTIMSAQGYAKKDFGSAYEFLSKKD